MNYPSKRALFAFLFSVLCLLLAGNVWAESGGLVLEWEQHWETYGVGGTCNFGTHNFFVGDVDSDGVMEMITGGLMYYVSNDAPTELEAPLRIWNWTGDTLNLENSQEWVTEDITEVKAIALNDVDGDEHVDIVTSGVAAVYGGFSDVDTPPETAQLRIWNWNGEELALKYSEDWQVGEGVVAWNVATGDLDKDGTVEIVTVGCMYVSALCDPDLRIWSNCKRIIFYSIPAVGSGGDSGSHGANSSIFLR